MCCSFVFHSLQGYVQAANRGVKNISDVLTCKGISTSFVWRPSGKIKQQLQQVAEQYKHPASQSLLSVCPAVYTVWDTIINGEWFCCTINDDLAQMPRQLLFLPLFPPRCCHRRRSEPELEKEKVEFTVLV